MKTILNLFDNRSPAKIILGSAAFSVVLSAVSWLAGGVVYFEPAFTIPIVFASWYGSKKSGYVISFVTTVLVVSLQFFASVIELRPGQMILSVLVHITSYVLLSILVTNFRREHRLEIKAADTDGLTGLLSSRAFYSNLTRELKRSIRYRKVFSLAYIDIDDFKKINDAQGHPAGDRLLIEVSGVLLSCLRGSDSVGRLGGDEFACLFPETGQEDARRLFQKLTGPLRKSMAEHGWSVSFSIGVVTFERMPANIKAAVKAADDLMYRVKKDRKDNIAYEVY